VDIKTASQSRNQSEAHSAAFSYGLIKWGLVFLFWTFLGLINVSQIYIEIARKNMDHSYLRILANELIGCWYVYFLFTPLILWLGHRFPIEKSSWKRNIPVHIIAFLILSALHSVTVNLAGVLIRPFGDMTNSQPFWEKFRGRYLSEFHLELMVYAMIIGIAYAVDYYNKFRERELRASQLEAQLAQAQLQVLKMQLHPHFLFNTINGIVGLVRDQKNKAAVEMLVGLSDLLRYTLQNSGKQEVSLLEELEFLELYLDIEQMRFSDRLKIEMKIAPETLEARVPNLILQPLVENSIRHGIAKKISAGLIQISSWVENGILNIKVYDDGPGLSGDWRMEDSKGIGLSNTRERLHQLYGSEYEFKLQNTKDGGVATILSLPLKMPA